MADPEPTKPKTVDPVAHERWLVISLVGLLFLTALALSIGFKDACAKYGGEKALADLGQRCKNVVTWQDYLPSSLTWGALLAVFVANVAAWEARWWIRVIAPALIGVAMLVVAVITLASDRPPVLAIFYALFGLGMLACVWGMLRDKREGWAFALSLTLLLAIAHFFGSATIKSAFGWPMSIAILPALAGFLPVAVTLIATPPGKPRPRRS